MHFPQDINNLRKFGLLPVKGGTSLDSSINVCLDNLVVIFEVSLPTAVWLLDSVLIVFAGIKRR